MRRRSVRYIIKPPEECPASLILARHPRVTPAERVEFDLLDVAGAAMREMIETQAAANPFLLFVNQLLVDGTNDLTWRGQGFGLGREMRRGLSGLFGRFFARAYLEQYHRYRWFKAIDGGSLRISRRIEVERRGIGGDMPDWLCSKHRWQRTYAGALAFAEAKGCFGRTILNYRSSPKPIDRARTQLNRAKLMVSAPGQSARECQVKRWAIMSRWGRQSSGIAEPVLFVDDPELPGEQLSEGEGRHVISEIARAHLRQTLAALGQPRLGTSIAEKWGLTFVRRLRQDETSEFRFRTATVVNAKAQLQGNFLGIVISPRGDFLPLEPSLLNDLVATPKNIRSRFFFFGLNVDAIYAAERSDSLEEEFSGAAYLDTQPSQREEFGELSIGPDGTILSTAEYVVGSAETVVRVERPQTSI